MIPSETAPASFDALAFKAAMRKVAGTVTVIGTSSATGLHGMTATAMCSVSADPPSVLVVINREARTHSHVAMRRAFTVNILSSEQREVADLFASKGDDQFATVAHRRLDDGCPVIAGAAAYLHCRVEDRFESGTHTIFVGRVIGSGVEDAAPLVYLDARYGRVSD